MKYVIYLLLLLSSSLVYGQEAVEVELQVGDTLYFGDCQGERYQYIDLMVKTRFELDSISYDSLSGWEFYNRFFNTGDFDVSRLPCAYQGRYCIIKHIMSIELEDGTWTNRVVGMIRDGSSAAYIVEEAFLNEELIFAPAHP